MFLRRLSGIIAFLSCIFLVTPDRSVYPHKCGSALIVTGSKGSGILHSTRTLEYLENGSTGNSIPIVIHSVNDSDVAGSPFLEFEHTDNYLLLPVTFYTVKHSAFCSYVFVEAGAEEHMYTVLDDLFWRRLARPHKDHFIFAGDWVAVKEALSHPLAKNLLYKFGLDVQDSSLVKPFQTNPLTGNHFRVTAVKGPQMARFINRPDGSYREGAGVYFEILREAGSRLNFTFSIGESSFGGASGFRRNGTWYGAVGQVFGGQADIAITAALTYQRYHIVDPAVPLGWIQRVFYVRRPPFSKSWTAVVRPLQPLVWAGSLLGAVVLVPVLHYSVSRVSSGSVAECAGVLVRITLEQAGGARILIGSRVRFITFLWAVSCLVLCTGYRSKLMNFLTFLDTSAVPRTHKELVESGYRLYFRYYGGVAYEYMSESGNPVHQAILAQAILVNSSSACIAGAGTTEGSACLDYDFHGDFALLTNGTLRSSSDGQSLFIKSDDKQIPLPMAFCFRKGSPITGSLSDFMMATLATGLYNRWLDEDWAISRVSGASWLRSQKDSALRGNLERISQDLSSSPTPLSRSRLFGASIVLGLGLSGGAATFLVEMSRNLFRFGRKKI